MERFELNKYDSVLIELKSYFVSETKNFFFIDLKHI